MAPPIAEDHIPEPAVPGYKNIFVYCDESGIGGQRYYGFGSLWIPQERQGDLAGLVRDLRERHGYSDEIKWNSVNKYSHRFYLELVQLFFRRKWIMFHCLVVRKAYVDKTYHKDFDETLRKHFAMLLASKVKFFCSKLAKRAYHVRVDLLPSRYKKADEAALKIVGNTLKKELGLTPVRSLITVDSKQSVGVQVSDLLLGAVMSDWQETPINSFRDLVRKEVAMHIGWNDLRADTSLKEWKFNIWYFFDPTGKTPREAKTRPVKLKVPMPPFRADR